ncbi:MAG TPA: amidohydrolase, partial [Thermoplasmata archaeon]|nr:amidohydrolase [Thermoplasmata archaeon]
MRGLTLEDSWELALKIHDLAEIGSAEVRSSSMLVDLLRDHGFEVECPYKGIPTAFRAERRAGSGTPVVAFLAEYDALRGIGHACGHNLIASSVVSAAIQASTALRNGRVVVIGTPDEEGSGAWAGSKILLADQGAFSDVDFAITSHPGDRWVAAGQTLAVQDLEVTFHGVAAHSAANPEEGRSALDAALLTYTAVNMLRQHVRRDANVVIHGVLREGGQASNVTPDKAVLVFGIRSSDLAYEEALIERFQEIVRGCCLATGTTSDVAFVGPLFSTTKVNRTLAGYMQKCLVRRGV